MALSVEGAPEGICGTVSTDGDKTAPLQVNVIHKPDLLPVEGSTAVDHGGEAHEVFCIIDLVNTLGIGSQGGAGLIGIEQGAHIGNGGGRQGFVVVPIFCYGGKDNGNICTCDIFQTNDQLADPFSGGFSGYGSGGGAEGIGCHGSKDCIGGFCDLCQQLLAVLCQLCGLAVLGNGNFRLRMGEPIDRRGGFHLQFIPNQNSATVIKKGQGAFGLGDAVVVVGIQHIHYRIASVIGTFVSHHLAAGIEGLSAGGIGIYDQGVLSLRALAVIGPAFAVLQTAVVVLQGVVVGAHFCDPTLPQGFQNEGAYIQVRVAVVVHAGFHGGVDLCGIVAEATEGGNALVFVTGEVVVCLTVFQG